jgi:type VI secretion system Hcp family effector
MGHTYAKITGKDQKDFKGESTRKGRDGWVELSMSFKSEFPVDPNTGKPKGSRERAPVVFLKEEGQASPNIFQAHLRHENITKMVIEKCTRGADGKSEVVVSRVTLEDGSIASYSAFPSGADTDLRTDPRHLEQFAVSYRKIKYENIEAKNATEEDWNEPNA